MNLAKHLAEHAALGIEGGGSVPTILVGYTEAVGVITGTTPFLNVVDGNIKIWTLTANSSPIDNLSDGQSLTLRVIPATYNVTWPSVVWTKVGGGGTAPTLYSAGSSLIVLYKIGSTLYGTYIGDA